MSGYTKGPWHTTVANNCGTFIETEAIGDDNCGNGDCITLVTTGGGLPTEANANLIAAAPELYEALDELVAAIQMIAPEAQCDPAVKALAKARGETL